MAAGRQGRQKHETMPSGLHAMDSSHHNGYGGDSGRTDKVISGHGRHIYATEDNPLCEVGM